MELKQYASSCRVFLKAHHNPTTALAQSKYMRNKFSFIGIKTPQRHELFKEFESIHGTKPKIDNLELAKEFIRFPEREMWYTALHFLDGYKSLLKHKDLPFLKEMIVHSDWWDIVDTLASNQIGTLCKNDTEAKIEVQSWISDENMWLRRTAIIYQLKYKDDTDVDFLSRAVLTCAHESEFFIRKAIGWALRQHSKTDPKFVRQFVALHRQKLSKLSIREATKYT